MDATYFQQLEKEIHQISNHLSSYSLSPQKKQSLEHLLAEKKRLKQTLESKLQLPSSANNHVLTKAHLTTLLAQQVDIRERLDPEVEHFLALMADSFVESVTQSACQLALHRNSNLVEAKDIQFHLEREWNIRVPGFGDERSNVKKAVVTETHKQRLNSIKRKK